MLSHNFNTVSTIVFADLVPANRFVTINGQLATSANVSDAFGITFDTYIEGESGAVGVEGVGSVLAGANIAAGDYVTLDAQGDIIPTATAGQELGRAIYDATVGHACEIVLLPKRL